MTIRLAIGRDGLGLELAEPVRVGPARVTQLASGLPTVRFPIDVSGGVARFRHRLGELRRVEVEIAAPTLERWAAPRLRGIVDARAQTPDVWVSVRPAGATICVASVADPDLPPAKAVPVVAFDVHLLAEGENLVLVVANARGAELPAPATAVAIACVQTLLDGLAARKGAAFELPGAAGALAKALLPEAGARAPSAGNVCWNVISADSTSWVLQAERDEAPAAPTGAAVVAKEIAALLETADDALVRGELDPARHGYLVALEHAPRHAEIVRRILDIDARVPGRAEAALAALAEARASDPTARFGISPAELLLQRGDRDAALAALERAGDEEAAPALAARAFELAARTAADPYAGLGWLDRALARAPRSCTARWLRLERRLAVGRLEEALADAEHLEAIARGPRARHAVWMRAGHIWRAAGLAGRAAPVFERALKYVPDEPMALGGLGAALVAEGLHARGASLLARALERADALGLPAAAVTLDLATALADKLDDLPSAIARVAAIASDAAEAPVARGLEGRWRARLGDLVGAGLAFARMRDGLASRSSPDGDLPSGQSPDVVGLLREAAHMERAHRGDALAAQRYLAEAVRLRPHDLDLRAAYRDACAAVAGVGGVRAEASVASPAGPPAKDPLVAERTAGADEVDREVRVEQLTRRLQAEPGDDAAADELASLLEALDRGHELLALLSGRLEDATPERRVHLAPRARAALERLATVAASEGRAVEADLYRSAAAALV